MDIGTTRNYNRNVLVRDGGLDAEIVIEGVGELT